jgi:hypothetical protein
MVETTEGSYILLLNLKLKGINVDETILYNPKMSNNDNKSSTPIYINNRAIIGYDELQPADETKDGETKDDDGSATDDGFAGGEDVSLDASEGDGVIGPETFFATYIPPPSEASEEDTDEASKEDTVHTTDEYRATLRSKYHITKKRSGDVVIREKRFLNQKGTGVKIFTEMKEFNNSYPKINEAVEVLDHSIEEKKKRIKAIMKQKTDILNKNLEFIINVILKDYSILTVKDKKYKIRNVNPPPTYFSGDIVLPKRGPHKLPTIYYADSDGLTKRNALFTRYGIDQTYLRTEVTLLVDDVSDGKYSCDDKRRKILDIWDKIKPYREKETDAIDEKIFENINKKMGDQKGDQKGGKYRRYGRTSRKKYTKRFKKKRKNTRRKRRSN